MGDSEKVIAFPKAAHDPSRERLLIPERITEARTALQMTQTNLAERVGVTRAAISLYEQGARTPDSETMSRIAAELTQPIVFFTGDRGNGFGAHSVNFFRSTGQKTKKRNLACEIYAKWFNQATQNFEHLVNFPAVDLPSFEPSGEDYSDEEIEAFAEKTRIHFGLGLGPISNVVRLLESKGVLVCRYVLEGENIEAFSFWGGPRPFIFLASDKGSAARARFDAAHELGHLCLHRWVDKSEVENEGRLKEIERQANLFAGAFLLPRKSFPHEVYSSRLESFIDLKARWKVSIAAMVYRCKQLGIYDDYQYTKLQKAISYKKMRKVEPLDKGPRRLPLEEPALLEKVTKLVINSGKFSLDELRLSLGLSDEVISRLLGYQLPTTQSENAPILTLK